MRTLPRDGVGTHRDRVGPHICINIQLGGRVGPVEPDPRGGAGQASGCPSNLCMIRKKNSLLLQTFLSSSPLDFWTFRRSFWAVARWQKDFPWRCPIWRRQKFNFLLTHMYNCTETCCHVELGTIHILRKHIFRIFWPTSLVCKHVFNSTSFKDWK